MSENNYKEFVGYNHGYVFEKDGRPYVNLKYGNLYYTRRLWSTNDGKQYADLKGYRWYLETEE